MTVAHDDEGNVVHAVRIDPDRPLETELEWVEANLAQGSGGQAMKDRKQRIVEELTRQKESS